MCLCGPCPVEDGTGGIGPCWQQGSPRAETDDTCKPMQAINALYFAPHTHFAASLTHKLANTRLLLPCAALLAFLSAGATTLNCPTSGGISSQTATHHRHLNRWAELLERRTESRLSCSNSSFAAMKLLFYGCWTYAGPSDGFLSPKFGSRYAIADPSSESARFRPHSPAQ